MIPAPFRAILRPLVKRLLSALAVSSLLAAGACGSPCEDLGDRICLCQPPGGQRDACKQAIRDQIGKGNPKPGKSQQDFCDERLRGTADLAACPNPSSDANACEKQATEAGKVQCGLAYDSTGA